MGWAPKWYSGNQKPFLEIISQSECIQYEVLRVLYLPGPEMPGVFCTTCSVFWFFQGAYPVMLWLEQGWMHKGHLLSYLYSLSDPILTKHAGSSSKVMFIFKIFSFKFYSFLILLIMTSQAQNSSTTLLTNAPSPSFKAPNVLPLSIIQYI